MYILKGYLPYKFRLRKVETWFFFTTNLKHSLLPICGKFTRALLAHQFFFHNIHLVPEPEQIGIYTKMKSELVCLLVRFIGFLFFSLWWWFGSSKTLDVKKVSKEWNWSMCTLRKFCTSQTKRSLPSDKKTFHFKLVSNILSV
jgi:hypothetical protein